MIIPYKYLVYWDKETKLIQNDYMIEHDQDANYDFSNTIDWFASNSLEEIEQRIIDLDLIIPD